MRIAKYRLTERLNNGEIKIIISCGDLREIQAEHDRLKAQNPSAKYNIGYKVFRI